MEFALVVPLLLVLLLGILEFGRVYNAQITLAQAAREGARVMAIENNEAQAKSSIIQAAAALDPAHLSIQIESSDPSMSGPVFVDRCLSGHQVTVRITYSLSTITGFFGPTSLSGRGAMRCGG